MTSTSDRVMHKGYLPLLVPSIGLDLTIIAGNFTPQARIAPAWLKKTIFQESHVYMSRSKLTWNLLTKKKGKEKSHAFSGVVNRVKPDVSVWNVRAVYMFQSRYLQNYYVRIQRIRQKPNKGSYRTETFNCFCLNETLNTFQKQIWDLTVWSSFKNI